MKFHAEFYARDLSGTLAPACGDRAVIILDGRITAERRHVIAADECNKRGFLAYRIMRGESFTRCAAASRIIDVSRLTSLQAISARHAFTVTFDIVTDESAAHGDTADSGFIAQGVTLREAAGLVGESFAQADHWPIRAWDRVRRLEFPEYGRDAARHWVDGELEARCLHIPAGVTDASSRRVARLFGVTVESAPAPSVPAPFFTSCSGDLLRNDSTCAVVRPRFAWSHRVIHNARELCATLRAGEWAWPGGYRLAFLMRDGEAICYGCARDELSQCVDALRADTRECWRIVGLVCESETDIGETCAHCNAVLWTGADGAA